MKLKPTIVWTLTISAFVFLFFSLRTETNQLNYSLVALGFWAAAYVANKFMKNEDEEKA